MSEDISMWDQLGNNYNQISIIIQFSGVLIAFFGLISWSASRDMTKNLWNKIKQFKNKVVFKIKEFKKLFIIKLREKIVGKENLELLKELKMLKGNKRAIAFLSDFNKEDEYSKVNGGYEALWIFTRLYSREMDFSEFKKAYEKDIEDRKQCGMGLNVNKLREDTFKKLIKEYSK